MDRESQLCYQDLTVSITNDLLADLVWCWVVVPIMRKMIKRATVTLDSPWTQRRICTYDFTAEAAKVCFNATHILCPCKNNALLHFSDKPCQRGVTADQFNSFNQCFRFSDLLVILCFQMSRINSYLKFTKQWIRATLPNKYLLMTPTSWTLKSDGRKYVRHR